MGQAEQHVGASERGRLITLAQAAILLGRSREWARIKYNLGELDGVADAAGSSKRIRVYESSVQHMGQVLAAQASGLSSADVRIADLTARIEALRAEADDAAERHARELDAAQRGVEQALASASELNLVAEGQKQEIALLRHLLDEQRARVSEPKGDS